MRLRSCIRSRSEAGPVPTHIRHLVMISLIRPAIMDHLCALPEIRSTADHHFFSICFEVNPTPSGFFLIHEGLKPAPLMFMQFPLSDDKLAKLRRAAIRGPLRDINYFHQFLRQTKISHDDPRCKPIFRAAFTLLPYQEQVEIDLYLRRFGANFLPPLRPQANHPNLPV